MNVLVLAQYFPPDMGGGSTRASNVVKGLLKKSCNITVIAAFPHYPHGKIPQQYKHKPIFPESFGAAQVYRVWIPAIPHSNVTNRLALHLCFIITSLFALPFIGKTDAVWGANPNLFCFFPSYFYSLIKDVPLVRNVDDLWPEVFYEMGYVKSKSSQKILDFLARLSYVLPTAVTPISSGYKSFIISKYGISPEKIVVIEVGVAKIPSISSVKSSNDKFTVIYSGVLGLGYDFDVVLNAAKLLSKNTEVIFIIRGIGELSSKLQNVLKKNCLKNVILDTRLLTEIELEKLLHSADVFVLPMANMSFVESGLPTKIFEYQAYCKPIICVSNGEPARYVKETMSGIIVNPQDYEALAEAILYLKVNRTVAENLGLSGLHYVKDNLSIDCVGSKMCRLLTKILDLKSV